MDRRRLVVLGGTSKVWRAMAPHWRETPEAPDVCVWARRAGPGVDADSAPDAAEGVLPGCDALFALWGVTGGDEGALARNTVLARRAQEIAAALGARVVLHAMTGAIYAPSAHPLPETARIDPRHAYGRAKWAAERAVREAAPLPVFLRLGNVAGCDALAAAVRSGRCVTLDRFTDGTTPRRSYVAPDDLVRVVAHLAACPPAGAAAQAINVAGPAPVDMAALLDAAGAPYDLRPAPPDALPLQHLDTRRLAAAGLDLHRSADPVHLAGFLGVGEGAP